MTDAVENYEGDDESGAKEKQLQTLVTGGAGFIGSHTAKELFRAGHQPIVVDDLSTGHDWAVQWGPLVRGNCGDKNLIRSVIREYGVTAVMHFAASAYVGESMEHPRKYFHNNVVNTHCLLEAMLEEGVTCIVFSSSCAVYGSQQQITIDETHPQNPLNPYGESKRMVERIIDWYGKAYGLNWIALRYFNAAGADADGDLREEHDPETHILPCIIEAAMGIRPYLEIYGTDYETSDGTAVRDFIHVSDLARAHVLALDFLARTSASQAFNLGTGVGLSVRQLVDAVHLTSGRRVPVRNLPRRAGDPAVLVANASKALSILGWKPERSSLEAIVTTAIRSSNDSYTDAIASEEPELRSAAAI